MTPNAFVVSLEKYYGNYPSEFMKNAVARYISRFSVQEIDATQELIFLNFSSQYGKTPDVAAIKKIQDENEETLRRKSGKVWVDRYLREAYCGDRLLGHFDGERFIPSLKEIQNTPALLEYAKEFQTISPTPEAYVKFLDAQGMLEDRPVEGLIEDKTGGEI